MGFWGSGSNWVKDNIFEPVEDHLINPIIDNWIKPGLDQADSYYDDDVVDDANSALYVKSGDGQIDDWKQTSEGNCVSVAVIKAAIDKYGSNMFADIEHIENGWVINLWDGEQVFITEQEYRIAYASSEFHDLEGSFLDLLFDDIGADNDGDFHLAILAYAVIAKRSLEEGEWDTYDQALDALEDGERPTHVIDLIGLKDYVVTVAPATGVGQAFIKAEGNGIITEHSQDNGHAIYVDVQDDTIWMDEYSSNEKFNGQTGVHGWSLDPTAWVFIDLDENEDDTQQTIHAQTSDTSTKGYNPNHRDNIFNFGWMQDRV